MLVNKFKSSVFCGTKGFLTFNLALLSYLEYGLYELFEQKDVDKIQYRHLKKGSVFTMQRNIIPFLEMLAIVPAIYFLLPLNHIQCALVCMALMVTICFAVRIFDIRKTLLEHITNYSKDEIKEGSRRDCVIYPVFGRGNKFIEYNFPGTDVSSSSSLSIAQNMIQSTKNSSCFATFFSYPLNVVQSIVMLSLAIIELLETIPSFIIDAIYGRNCESTKSNIRRAGHLLYASIRNVLPMSKLDEPVSQFIGVPQYFCCSA